LLTNIYNARKIFLSNSLICWKKEKERDERLISLPSTSISSLMISIQKMRAISVYEAIQICSVFCTIVSRISQISQNVQMNKQYEKAVVS